VEDTYAEKIRNMPRRNLGHMDVAPPLRKGTSNCMERISAPQELPQTEKVEVVNEKVVVNNKDTMVFESTVIREDAPVEAKKRKSIDDVMNLDLPDDYEKEFWK
jgi:hypothetical protein